MIPAVRHPNLGAENVLTFICRLISHYSAFILTYLSIQKHVPKLQRTYYKRREAEYPPPPVGYGYFNTTDKRVNLEL